MEEKGVPYRLEEVDVFSADRGSPAALERQPFGKIPSFEHDGFQLYETGAITRYVDEAFAGPSLQPAKAQTRARMNQVIGILDSYLYRSLVWGVYMHQESDGVAALEASLSEARRALAALSAIMGGGAFLNGDDALSLADLHAYPMIRYGVMNPQGRTLLSDEYPAIDAWRLRMAARASAGTTLFPKELT